MKSLRVFATLLILLFIIVLSQSSVKNTENKKTIDNSQPVPSTSYPTENIENNSPYGSSKNSENDLSHIQPTAWYIYSNASVESRTPTSVTLSSNDSPSVITNWYEKRIKDKEIKNKTFIRTQTNGIIKNILSGNETGDEFRIEVTKQPDTPSTIITIHITTI